MREIKFRAQRKLNGEWTYGNFVKGPSEDWDYIFGEIDEIGAADPVRVISKTVGQFIGQQDKNGTDLYEGDVVEWMDNEEMHRGPVFFDMNALAFRVQMKMGYFPSFKLLAEDLEVIGDIYRNPDLLK